MESQPTFRHRSANHVQFKEKSCYNFLRRDVTCNTPKPEYRHHLPSSSYFQVGAPTK